MKRIAIAAAVLAATALGSVGAASAAGVEFDVGNGGVYVGPRDHDFYRERHFDRGYRAYGYEPGCRMVVRTRVNEFGERVTVRRRICD